MCFYSLGPSHGLKATSRSQQGRSMCLAFVVAHGVPVAVRPPCWVVALVVSSPCRLLAAQPVELTGVLNLSRGCSRGSRRQRRVARHLCSRGCRRTRGNNKHNKDRKHLTSDCLQPILRVTWCTGFSRVSSCCCGGVSPNIEVVPVTMVQGLGMQAVDL